jgi:hypothetical protein
MAACINGATIQFLVQAFDLERGLPSRNLVSDAILLRSSKGRFGLIDYEKTFCPDLKSGDNIFDQRGTGRPVAPSPFGRISS